MNVVATATRRDIVPAGGRTRSDAIYGIRGLAALALLTVHVAMFSGLMGTKALGTPRPPTNFLGAFFVSGMPSFIGVLFVFPAVFLYLPFAKAVIAGDPRPQRRGGLLRRLVRLLPAYYVMYLVVLLALNRDAIDGVWYILRPVLLLQVYLPSPFVPRFINGMEVTWTVPSMVQWYLVLPLIAWATRAFAVRGATPAARARRLMLPVPLLIAVGVGWLFFVKANGWDNRIVFWWPQGFAPTIAIGMALAILLALAQVSPADTPRLLRAAANHPNRFWLGAMVVYLVNCARPFSVIGMDAIYSVSGLLVTYLMVAAFGLLAVAPLIAPGGRRHVVRTVLGTRPLAYLGRVSYGIYLWHFAMMHFYLQPRSVVGGHPRPLREFYGSCPFWLLELVTVAGTVLIASLSYFLLEQPLSNRVERYLRERRIDAPIRAELRRPAAATLVPAAPGSAVLTAEEAPATVATAVSDRDAVRANIVDLERSFGRQLLASATLTGGSRARWDSASADLAALWETFQAYSGIIDEALRLAAGRHPSTTELAQITELLTEAVIVLSGPPAPLAQRHITDSGCRRLTVTEAIGQMNELFSRVAELVTTAETIWKEVTAQLDRVDAELSEAKRQAASVADPIVPTAFAEAEAESRRLRQLLETDPLALSHNGRTGSSDLEKLRQSISRARQLTKESL